MALSEQEKLLKEKQRKEREKKARLLQEEREKQERREREEKESQKKEEREKQAKLKRERQQQAQKIQDQRDKELREKEAQRKQREKEEKELLAKRKQQQQAKKKKKEIKPNLEASAPTEQPKTTLGVKNPSEIGPDSKSSNPSTDPGSTLSSELSSLKKIQEEKFQQYESEQEEEQRLQMEKKQKEARKELQKKAIQAVLECELPKQSKEVELLFFESYCGFLSNAKFGLPYFFSQNPQKPFSSENSILGVLADFNTQVDINNFFKNIDFFENTYRDYLLIDEMIKISWYKDDAQARKIKENNKSDYAKKLHNIINQIQIDYVTLKTAAEDAAPGFGIKKNPAPPKTSQPKPTAQKSNPQTHSRDPNNLQNQLTSSKANSSPSNLNNHAKEVVNPSKFSQEKYPRGIPIPSNREVKKEFEPEKELTQTKEKTLDNESDPELQEAIRLSLQETVKKESTSTQTHQKQENTETISTSSSSTASTQKTEETQPNPYIRWLLLPLTITAMLTISTIVLSVMMKTGTIAITNAALVTLSQTTFIAALSTLLPSLIATQVLAVSAFALSLLITGLILNEIIKPGDFKHWIKQASSIKTTDDALLEAESRPEQTSAHGQKPTARILLLLTNPIRFLRFLLAELKISIETNTDERPSILLSIYNSTVTALYLLLDAPLKAAQWVTDPVYEILYYGFGFAVEQNEHRYMELQDKELTIEGLTPYKKISKNHSPSVNHSEKAENFKQTFAKESKEPNKEKNENQNLIQRVFSYFK